MRKMLRKRKTSKHDKQGQEKPEIPLLEDTTTGASIEMKHHQDLFRGDRESSLVLKPPNLKRPFNVIWHEGSDEYIVTDESSGNVKVMNPDDGTTTAIAVTNGTKPRGIIMSPRGHVGSDPGYIFTDTARRRILRLSGGICEEWGDPECRRKIQCPLGLAMSLDNCIYIADYSKNGRIHKVTSSGRHLGELDRGDLKRPRSVAVNSRGNIFVADETASIKIYTAVGSIVNPLGMDTDGKTWICRSVAVDKFDNIFITAYQAYTLGYPFSNEKVMVFDKDMRPLCSFGGHWNEFHNIRGIGFDYKRNRILVVDGHGSKLNIYKLYESGQ